MPSYDPEQLVFEQEVVSSITPVLGIEDRPKTFLETLFYAWQVTWSISRPSSGPACSSPLPGCPSPCCPS